MNPVLQNLIGSLSAMNPAAIVEAAAEAECISTWSSEKLQLHAAELRRAEELARACCELWQEVCNRTALNLSGYSASGVPVGLECSQTGDSDV